MQGNEAIIMTWKVSSPTTHSLGLNETLCYYPPLTATAESAGGFVPHLSGSEHHGMC